MKAIGSTIETGVFMNRFGIGLLAFSFAAAAAAQSSLPNWTFAHPDATALIGIDIRNLRESSVGQSLAADFNKTSNFNKQGAGMFHFPGMELLQEIDQVFISSPGAKSANKKENPPFLILVTGHFMSEHVQQFLRGQHKTYGSVDIYSTGEGSKAANLAALDEKTILIGDTVSVRAAIDRRSQKTATPTPLLARANALARVNDFWLITNVSPSDFQPADMKFGEFIADVKGIETGISLHDGLNFELSLSTKSPEAAHAMAELLLQLTRESIKGKVDDQQAAEILRNLQVGSEDDRMQVKFALSKEELERQLRAMQAARALAAVPRSAAPRPKVEDSGPKSIKIFGLDEGIREIPLPPAKN
jgi:hypothetical protein